VSLAAKNRLDVGHVGPIGHVMVRQGVGLFRVRNLEMRVHVRGAVPDVNAEILVTNNLLIVAKEGVRVAWVERENVFKPGFGIIGLYKRDAQGRVRADSP